MPGSVEAGNKMIVNVGTVKMIGQPRSRQSVLTAVANKGSSSITVEPGLDWVAGDKIGFAPTASQWTHYESAVIASYDIATGAITLTAPLQYYHFGAAASTGTNYQGLDMRGEVVLLTRNIKIRGDVSATNDWHGHMLTIDSFQFDNTLTNLTLHGTEGDEMSSTGYYDNCESLYEDYEEVPLRDIDPEDLMEWTHFGDS